jgi:hypothetical protein
MVSTNYGFQVSVETFYSDINRLTNQLWKLIPMRENSENWLGQLDTVIIELTGLNQILSTHHNFIILLSKLEGLKVVETEFNTYRKTVFEAISLLREMRYDE